MYNDDPEERKRVSLRIAEAIKDFCYMGREFHMGELVRSVTDHVEGYVSPDSPSRILRLMRSAGRLNYKLVSRAESLYRIIPVFDKAHQVEMFPTLSH